MSLALLVDVRDENRTWQAEIPVRDRPISGARRAGRAGSPAHVLAVLGAPRQSSEADVDALDTAIRTGRLAIRYDDPAGLGD